MRNLQPAHGGKEQRKACRVPVCLPGRVRMPGYLLALPCRIVNVSSTGAGVELTELSPRFRDAGDLPDAVTLTFTLDRAEVDCEVRWRDNIAFGVRFRSILRKQR